MDASSIGNEVNPDGDGATAAPSISPVQQSTLFPIFRRERREFGSHRRRLPLYETRRAFQPRLMGDRGRLRRRTIPM
jgi:hypothetical protein